MSLDPLIDAPALTRRAALQAGAGTAAAALLLLHPWASAAIAATGDPSHLVRSSYLKLIGQDFAVGASRMRLVEVKDLPAASVVRSLRGAEEAFVAFFKGPPETALPAGVHTMRHPALGTFALYVGRCGIDGDIEVVVNRIPNPTRSASAARAESAAVATAAARAPADTAAPAATAAQDPGRLRKPPIRQVKATRSKHGVKVVAELADGDITQLTAWLRRGDRALAATSRSAGRHRVAFNLRPARRLRRGTYELVLMATAAGGEQSFLVERLKLR